MGLRYDFGIVAVTADQLPGHFAETGMADTGVQKVAMFCDSDVLAALKSADKTVRSFFVASGFALQTCDNGAPPGRYPAKDEDDRATVIERLSQNLMAHDLENADWGGFDFSAFMDSLSDSQPIVDELLAPTTFSLEPQSAPEAPMPAEPKGRRMVAIGILTVGLVLLLYVASQLIM